MKTVLQLLKRALIDIVSFFHSDINDIMSKKAQAIFQHREDRRKYVKACWRLHKGITKQETIVLHTGEEITLIII